MLDVVKPELPEQYPQHLRTMHYQFTIFGQLIVALILVVLAEADYIMDDSNSTIKYMPKGVAWSRDVSHFDTTKLFNNSA
jgi:hypothetical protein